MVTIQQTVEIPDNRRLVIDIPQEIPAGMAKVSLIFNGFGDDRYDRIYKIGQKYADEVLANIYASNIIVDHCISE
jgi:hypothetical protein